MGTSKEKVVMSGSGGKDSALALKEILQNDKYEVVSLLTTVSEGYERISHHGVRRELLEQQAEAIGIPLHEIQLPHLNCTNEIYESIMHKAMVEYIEQEVNNVVFGDIFLEDLREYREKKLAIVGMKGIFPIWKRDTAELVNEFISVGFKGTICCITKKSLRKEFCGREINEEFLKDLPDSVDPCGENGEFHSFVYDGPIFHNPVKIKTGETILRDVRYFTDLLPANSISKGENYEQY